MAKKKKEKRSRGQRRFPERGKKDWRGPIVSYREVELLRKVMTSSAKVMSRKRAGTTAREQSDVQAAIKHARFLALVPYTGT
ncbi:MAG: 30S ribosomal protein S18 [Phycisphaerae bacterium]